MPAAAAPLLAAVVSLALDLAGVAPPSLPRTSSAELRVEAEELLGHVFARLTNVSAQPVEVAVGSACGGATLLVAYDDSSDPPKATPLKTERRGPPCAGDELLWVLLPPGEETVIATDALSPEGLRRDAVTIAYEVAHVRPSPSGVRRVTGPVRARWMTKAAPIVLTLRVDGDELVADHVVAPSSERQTFLLQGACPRSMTALVVDDVEVPGWPNEVRACAGYRVSPVELSNATWVSHRNPWPRFWGRVDTVAPITVPR